MLLKEVGFVIMLFVVFIMIGSIMNGCVVMCICNLNVMLYVGFVLFVVVCVGIVVVIYMMLVWMLMVLMVVGGIGFGFVLLNFIVFV